MCHMCLECTVHPCGRPRQQRSLSPFSSSSSSSSLCHQAHSRSVTSGTEAHRSAIVDIYSAQGHFLLVVSLVMPLKLPLIKGRGRSNENAFGQIKRNFILSHLTTLSANIKTHSHTCKMPVHTGMSAQKWFLRKEATLPSDV